MKKSLVFLAACSMVFAIAMSGKVQAQSNILYSSSRNPLINTANPAFFPKHTGLFFALPGANANFSSPLSYHNIFQIDSASNKAVIDINRIIDTLYTNESIRLNALFNGAGIGINFGKLFLTASVQLKTDIGFNIPSGLLTFANEGNYNRTNVPQTIHLLDGNLVNVRVYGEAAAGIGLKILDQLTVGARVKMLVGYLDVSDAGTKLDITTAPDQSSLLADFDLNVNYSVPDGVNIDTNFKVDYRNLSTQSLTPKNYGINFDLGARYATDLFEVSASVLDIGPGIHWKENIYKVVSANNPNTIEFTGVDLTNSIQNGKFDVSIFNELKDSLMKMTEYEITEGTEYWTSIPTKVNLGSMYKLSKGLSLGVLFHGEFERGLERFDDVFKQKTRMYSRTSVLARLDLAEWVEIVAATSIVSNKGNLNWFNPGIGLTVTPLRFAQAYVFLDYISNIYVLDAKQLNISAGVNMLFGVRGRK